MTRRARRGLAAAAGAACITVLTIPPASVAAQSGSEEVPARECCLPLLFSIGARALALGDAITARTDPGALFANPALIANLGTDQFLVHNANTSIEKSNTLSILVHSEVAGTFGLNYRLIDYGEQEARDQNGNPTGTIAVLAHVLNATYATRVVAGVNAGVSYKLYQFRQDCRGFCGGVQGFSATTHGLDLGAQYEPGALPALRLGAAVVHLGFPLQVVNSEQASPMPVRVRLGAAYEAGHHFLADTTIAIWTSVDAITSARDGRTYVNVGAELALEETIYVRAGYGGAAGLAGGAAAGVGLKYDRFDISVAKSFVSSPIDETEPVQISFGIRF